MTSKIFLFILMPLLCVSTLTFGQNKTFHSSKAPAPEAGTMFIFPERIILENGGFFNAERAIMFVPLNRSEITSDVISLDVYRFKASEKANPDTPPIFYLHGGPGFQGLEDQLNEPGYFEKNWQYMLDVADVVVVSQRGIGPSKPTTTIETTTYIFPPDVPFNNDQAVDSLQKILSSERMEWEKLGLDLKGFTILEAAEDVNDVRKALGYDRITIWGGSFGSHWGMSLMRLHPEIIERAILRGMEGPDHTYDHPGHQWNVYKRVAEDAENAPELRGLIPKGGLIAAAETIVKRIEKKPVTVEVKDTVTGEIQTVIFDVHSAKKLVRGYSNNLASWPAEIITLYNGDFTSAAEIAVKKYKSSGRTFTTASYYMLDCGSGITAQRLEEMSADPSARILENNWDYINECPCWDSDLGDDFRKNFETYIPSVIVQGTWDRSTPYENALELVPYFKDSKFITLKRGPHSAIKAAMQASPEFKDGILRFAGCGDKSGLPDKLELPQPEWVVPVSNQ
jgi:pimeloyl-ACP methyl ester carboxylesterase